MDIKYPDQNFKTGAIEALNAKEELIITISGNRVVKWLNWYLPYLLRDLPGESPPFLRTLYSMIVLRHFHAVFGVAFQSEKYKISFNAVTKDIMKVYFQLK